MYNNEITSELFALISAFFFSLCAAANILDRWGFKKTWGEIILLTFLSLLVMCAQFLVQIEVESKSRFWTTNPCLYSLGLMVIFQMWRLQKTS